MATPQKAKSFIETSPLKQTKRSYSPQPIETCVVYEPISLENAQSALEEAMIDL
jgi:hypothetical protein